MSTKTDVSQLGKPNPEHKIDANMAVDNYYVAHTDRGVFQVLETVVKLDATDKREMFQRKDLATFTYNATYTVSPAMALAQARAFLAGVRHAQAQALARTKPA